MEWQTIDTHPKQPLRNFLVFDTQIGVTIGYWTPDDGWMVTEGCCEMLGEDDVTHWMPLPTPPKEEPQ